MEILLYTVLLIYLIFMGYWFIPPLFGRPPYYPTKQKQVRKMVELAQIQKEDSVVDLGSGDGRIVLEAAKYSDNVTGIEFNPFFVIITKAKALFLRRKATVRRANIFNEDFSQYDIVFCYLLPKTMKDLALKFQNELKPGSKVITNTFHASGLKLIKEEGKLQVYVKE